MTARAVGLAALLALSGCKAVPLQPQPVPGPDEGEWARLRDGHLRSKNLYDGLALHAFASAVWESPAVRAARVERIAVWRRMSDAERAAFRASEEKAAADFDEFTVALFTPDRNDNDLDANRPSWRMAVVGSGWETVAPKATQLRVDAELRALYPMIGDFDAVYRIRFPKRTPPLGNEPFTLRIAGALGSLDFPFPAGP